MHRLNVYRFRTKDTLEEKLFGMHTKKELKEEDLKSLIEYKANKILNIRAKSTLNMEQNIDEILKNALYDDDEEDDDCELVEEEEQTKYTLKDIINHPENQGVIRVFVCFFIAMIVIPILTVIFLNRYVMEHYLLDWSVEGKENVTIVIGVGIAHIIGLIYVCYAWSGEDRIPAHILDADEDESKQKTKENDDSPKSSDSSSDRRQYMFVERQDVSNNGLRKRKNIKQQK